MDIDGDSTLSMLVDDIIKVELNGAACFYFDGSVALPVNGVTFTATAAGVAPKIKAQGTDTNIDLMLQSKGTGDVILADASGEEILIAADVATAVNEITVTNAATAGSPSIAATGGDTNVGLTLTTKGIGLLVADGSLQLTVGADVASAAALPVNIKGNFFDVTGTTTVTSLAAKGAGSIVVLQFDGVLTLTHHATDLILPGGYNIRTYAGFIATFYEYASGDWRLIDVNGPPSLGCMVIAYFTGDFGTTTDTYIEVGQGSGTYTEVIDRGGDFDAANGRFTAPVAGIYDVQFAATLITDSANPTEQFFSFISNTIGTVSHAAGSWCGASALVSAIISSGSGKISMTAGQIISLWTWHSTGVNRSLAGGSMGNTSLCITLIS